MHSLWFWIMKPLGEILGAFMVIGGIMLLVVVVVLSIALFEKVRGWFATPSRGEPR